MAKITKPTEQVIGTGGQLSLDDAGRVGRSQMQLGGEVAQAGKQFFEQAKNAIDLAAYSNSMSSATKEFNELAQKRYSTMVDKDGNPTHESLPTDIDKIGKDVLNKHLGTLTSPGAAAQFRNNFGNFVNNQSLSAVSKASSQALSFARDSIFNNLESLKENSLINPESVVDNQALATQLLEDAVQAGSLTPFEAEEQAEKYRSMVAPEITKQQIFADPQGMRQALEEQGPEAFNLNYMEHQKLLTIADKAIIDQQKREEAIQKVESARLKSAVDLRISEFEMQLAKDGALGVQTVTESLILADETLENDPEKRNKLLEKLYKTEGSMAKKAAAVNGVTEAISSGASLSGFTPSELNAWFESGITNLAESNGVDPRQIPLSTQIGLAAQAGPTSIPVFNKRIGEALKAGDSNKAVEAVQALKSMESINPEMINNFDERTKAIYHMASSKIFEGNMDPNTALEQARETVLSVDTVQQQELQKRFESEEDFKFSEIESLIEDQFDTWRDGGLFDAEQAAGVQTLYRRKLKEGYVLMQGDADAAIKYATNELKGTLGETEFNGSNHIMIHAPDKIFSQYGYDLLKENLDTQIANTFGDTVDPDDVIIRSDRHTRGIFSNGEEIISYGLFTEDGQPIINPRTGRPDRWVVRESDMEAFKSYKRGQELQAEIKSRRTSDELIDRFTGGRQMGERRIPVDNEGGNEDMGASGGGAPTSNAKPELHSKLTQGYSKMASGRSTPYTRVIEEGLPVLEKYGIDNEARLRHFLAQVGHESWSFTATVEKPSRKSGRNFEKYEGVRVLGNTQPGDGKRFRGRGMIQLTGRDNYTRIGKMIGVDLVNNPDLAADPELSLEIAAAYWKSRGLNELADRDNFKEITRRVNGGFNGIEDRKRRFRELAFLSGDE